MRRACLLGLALALAACGDNAPATPRDAGPGAPSDAVPDGGLGAAAIAPCLDPASDVVRPPAGALPCDLISPGVKP